jgi:redox-regulated HSP33 family molecular chaperone
MAIIVNPSTSGNPQNSDHLAATTAKVMVNGDILFNIVGDVSIRYLYSECYTANDATATTMQYNATANAVSSVISNPSASLANAAIGVAVVQNPASLTTTPTLTLANGVALNLFGEVRIKGGGTINLIIAVGSTTGTWRHYVRYEPLETGAYVTPAF